MNEYRDQAQDKDWEQISELLQKADCVPDAPDCRAAVMSRIARPRPARRFVWAYASGFAALLVAAIGFAPFLMSPDKSEMVAYSPRVEQSAPAPESAPKPPLVAFNHKNVPAQPQRSVVRHAAPRKPVMMAKAAPAEGARVPVLVDRVSASVDTKVVRYSWNLEKSKRSETTPDYSMADSAAKAESFSAGAPTAVARRLSPASRPTRSASENSDTRVYDYADATAAPAPSESRVVDGAVVASAAPAKPEMAPDYGLYSTVPNTARARGTALSGVDEKARPVAVAIVSWPSASSNRADSYSYGYKQRDVATGQTTECTVRRSGNAVEIYLESKPEAQEPPLKGSVEHETKPSV